MIRVILSLTLMVILSGCAATPKPETQEHVVLQTASFSDLPGWNADTIREALPALQSSCARILKKPAGAPFGKLDQARTYGEWHPVCRALANNTFRSDAQLRAFFEHHFQPYAVTNGKTSEGLFTGYYEATLRGSQSKHGLYRYPLHARPDDLVMVQLGDFREDLKGRRIAGRVVNGSLKPYEDRADIVAGQWPHNDKVLLWVDSPVDAFFVQIQGSGTVEMDDGSIMRIGYAGQNGHPYYAIGRELIKRGALTKDTVSMQSIREWLEHNPDQADEVMNTNQSYVFFTAKSEPGAIGGEGVVLTPERSLAIDHTLLPYGLPVWVSAQAPMESETDINRLMVAQDTGGAIRGAVRGDVFWGHGKRAEHMAGPMKSRGQYWVLLPR